MCFSINQRGLGNKNFKTNRNKKVNQNEINQSLRMPFNTDITR